MLLIWHNRRSSILPYLKWIKPRFLKLLSLHRPLRHLRPRRLLLVVIIQLPQQLLIAKANLLLLRPFVLHNIKLFRQSALLRLHFMKLQQLLIDQNIKVDITIVLQRQHRRIKQFLAIRIGQIVLLCEIFQQLGVLLQNHVVQELRELIVAELTGQRNESFLEEPFVQEIELLSSLRHVFVLVFRQKN